MTSDQYAPYVVPPITAEQLDVILAFLPVFADPAFTAGEWVEKDDHLPWVDYHPAINQFWGALYANGNDLRGFHYFDDPDVLRLNASKDAIDTAELDALRKFLYYLSRGERFCDGFDKTLFECGEIVRILRRMAEIRRTLR